MGFEKYSKPNCVLPHYIAIKKSKIQGAGEGAFATCDIPANVVIGEYLGKIYTGDKMYTVESDYLFSVNKNGKLVRVIDGDKKRYASWVRYVNSPQNYEEGNASFYQYGGRIFLKTIRPIPKGQEIYAYYGDEYVDDKLKPYFTKNNKPKVSTVLTGYSC